MKIRFKANKTVFFVSASVVLLFLFFGAAFSRPMGALFQYLQNTIVASLGWFYIISVAFFLFFVLWLFFSAYGKIRLGKDHNRPEFSNFAWFSMLFSAGMGIGLLFYGVAEPVMHFASPLTATDESVEAAKQAMRLSFFHWGLHAWAIYIVVGLSLALFAYRYDLPLSIRSTLYPLLGDKIYGPIGNTIDILAVFGTLFGIATSLGLGAMQINAGLDFLGLAEVSTKNQLFLITGITLVATISVLSGLERGVRFLSQLNLVLAFFLLMFVLLAGPTVFLLSSFVQSIGSYIQYFPEMTFRTNAFAGIEWQKQWTMFYWGWWISWSPFVGMFIARISRGRTIREFIGGVLLVPTLLTFLWLVIFGNNAIYLELFGGGGMVEAVSDNVSTALFFLLQQFPLSTVTTGLAITVIALFFITSADSGSLVVDILTSDGRLDSPVWQRVFWAFSKGGIAAVLLLTGGLMALQTAALITALPFCIIMLFMCQSLVRELRAVPKKSYRDIPEDTDNT